MNQSTGSAVTAPVANLGGAPSQSPGPQPDAGEPAIRLNLADDSELLREFHGESLELLQNIEQGVLVLEENPADAATINSIFRAFHTLKGGAGLLHLDALRDLAHDLESLLDAARRSELSITSEVIELILAGGDTLKHFTHEIGAQIQGANLAIPSLSQPGRSANGCAPRCTVVPHSPPVPQHRRQRPPRPQRNPS